MTAVRTPLLAGDPARRTAAVLAAVSLPPAVLAGVIGGLVVGVLAGPAAGLLAAIVLLVAVAAALASSVASRAAREPRPDIGGASGTEVDPVRHARLVNLVDGLCVNAGVRVPALRVVDAPGCNLAVIGRDPSHSVLVVTSALLDHLTRMQLEGVLATGIVQLRRRDAGPLTVAVAAGGLDVAGLARRMAADPQRDRLVDEAAVALTRYPPGLISAYRRVGEVGTAVGGVDRGHAPLWLIDPSSSEAGAGPVGGRPDVPGRTPLQERIDALEEL